MSTIVYQGLQSCFESQLIETTTLKLRVAAAAAASTELKAEKCRHIQEISSKAAGWSFIQNLSNFSTTAALKEGGAAVEVEQSSYVHHPSKRAPRLSQESLELCTENLGSETGSDSVDISILNFFEVENSGPEKPTKGPVESRNQANNNDNNKNSRFPPPLTTIRSSNPLQVRPRREGGRLIIQAVETPSRNTYLQAERSNGRLRLSFCATNFDAEMANEEENNDEDEDDEYESDIDGEDYYRNCHESEAEQQDDDHEENDGIDSSRDIDGNRTEAEGNFGIEKFQRPSRCKESGHGKNKNTNLCNWRNPLWVATS